MLYENKIVVIIQIPLLEINHQFDIYQVFNLPLAVPNLGNAQSMIATYQLESEGFMINKAHTKYAILTAAETNICSKATTTYCKVESPIYPVNLARLCVINLFLRKQNEIEENCKSVITLNTKLPSATKLMGFLWGVVSQESLRFSIVCNNDQSKTITLKPPIDILEVPTTCVASSDYFTLTASYQKENDYDIRDQDLALLRSINISQLNVIRPLQERYPNFTKIPLPKSLKPIQQISLDGLLAELDTTAEIKIKNDAWPKWVYFIIGSIIMSIAIGCMYLCCKYHANLSQTCSSLRESCRAHETVNTKPKPGVSTTIDNQASDCGGPTPSAPVAAHEDVTQKLYPSLFKMDGAEVTGL